MKNRPGRIQTALFSLLLLASTGLAANAATKADKTAQDSKQPVITVHGRLFVVASKNPEDSESIVLATAEGVYYKLHGPLLDEIRQKAQELSAKEIWLTGEKGPTELVRKTIRNIRDDQGKLIKKQKEILEYILFDVLAIEKTGDVVDIAAPAPRIAPLTEDEEREAAQRAAVTPPAAAVQIEGKIVSVANRKSPIITLQVKTADPAQPVYQIMITSDTRINKILLDEQNKEQQFVVEPRALKKGDRIIAWIIRDKNRFEAQIINIVQ